MIGDKEDDITAANNFGIFNTILVESGHKINKHNTQAKFILPSIKAINGVI
jgi:phosphoglycolate phosphatase-like HAD superfamily hydrolase